MTARIVVVGLGPAGPGLLTAETVAAIDRIAVRFVRTSRHPTATAVPRGRSFDWVYEQAACLDDVYPSIVAALIEAAEEHGEILYAVPGSPVVAERTVELLQGDARVDVEILPAMSFLDLAWARLGVDPLALGVRLIDGHRFATEAAGQRGPLLVAQCDSKTVLSDIKLSIDGGPLVTVLQQLGLPDEAIFTVSWDELDRAVRPDHLTSLWLPELAPPVAAELVLFDELVHTLRERCPWDREQTHQSLTRHLLEETYEVLEAIDGLGAPDSSGWIEGAEHLEEELGDLLFQVVFHATLASEEGLFDLADVARGIRNKLIHRHPHVFGDVEARTAGQVMHNWEQIKQVEKGRESVMDGIPNHLPSLLYAHKAQRKAASVGFDWDGVGGAWPKIAEETAELAVAVAAAAGAGQGGAAQGGAAGDVVAARVSGGAGVGVSGGAGVGASGGVGGSASGGASGGVGVGVSGGVGVGVSGGASVGAGGADMVGEAGGGGGGVGGDGAVEEELGDLLFAVVNVARHLDVDPEAALRSATLKFRDRFMAVERLAAARGLELRALDLVGLDALWDEVKASGVH